MVSLSGKVLKAELKNFVIEMADDLIMDLRKNRKKDNILGGNGGKISKKEMYV